MAMSSLRYKAHERSSNSSDDTKKGTPIYNGAPTEFHEWQFRTQLRAEAIKDDDISRAVDDIVGALRGDALQVAMDIGISDLKAKGGIVKLVTAVRAIVFPSKKLEAK